MSVRGEAAAVKEAWARASGLSADGLLHDAVMEFLRIRYVLRINPCTPGKNVYVCASTAAVAAAG